MTYCSNPCRTMIVGVCVCVNFEVMASQHRSCSVFSAVVVESTGWRSVKTDELVAYGLSPRRRHRSCRQHNLGIMVFGTAGVVGVVEQRNISALPQRHATCWFCCSKRLFYVILLVCLLGRVLGCFAVSLAVGQARHCKKIYTGSHVWPRLGRHYSLIRKGVICQHGDIICRAEATLAKMHGSRTAQITKEIDTCPQAWPSWRTYYSLYSHI